MSNAEDKDEGLGRPAGGGKMPTARGRKDNAKPYERSSSSLFARFCSNVKDYLVPSYFTYNLSGLNVQPKDDMSKIKGSNKKPGKCMSETSGLNARTDNYLGAMRGLNAKPDDELSVISDSHININKISGQEKSNKGTRPMDIDSYQTAMSSAASMETDSSIHSNFRRFPLESVRITSGVDPSSDEQSTRYRLDGPTTSENSVKHRQSLPLFEEDLNGSECYASSSITGITDKFVTRPAMTSFSDSNVSRSIVPPSSDKYLWSSERNNDARKQAVPSFDVSAFSQSVDQTVSDVSKIASTPKLSISSRIDGESLFYAGQTTYGGASSFLRASRSDLSSSPYQRRETKTQQVNAKPSGALGNAGVTSSTSRRMLEAIQRGEDSRVSLRNLQSRNSIVDITSQTSAPSTSVFHRNSAQFDATVSKDSLLSNSVRAAPRASDVNRISASPPGIALPSKSTYFNNPEFGRTTNATEIIRERPQESGGKMKRALKVQKHYSSRQDDDEDTVESDPLLRTIEPLPSININPGFLEAATSAEPSGFTFSMPQEVRKTSSMPCVMDNKVANSMSALINENIQFRVPSEIGIANTKSSSSVSNSTSNAPATASLHSIIPLPLFGSKSVSDQFSSASSVTQHATVTDAGFFNAPETSGFKIGASSNLSNRSNYVSNESNLSMANNPVAESNGSSNTTVRLFGSSFTSKSTSDERKMNSFHEPKERLPNITEDGLSRPPLRDDTNTVATTLTNSSIVSSSNIVVVANKPVSSTEKMTSVTKISSASTQDTNVNAHCANETPAVVPLSELFKKSANVWTCDECFVSNKSDTTVCVSCDTARPGHAPPSTLLSTVVQDATRITTNSGSAKLTGTGSMFSFGSLPKESATSDGRNAVASGFRPSNANLFSSSNVGLFSSSSIPLLSGSDGITVDKDGIVAKSSMFGSGSVFGAPAHNSSVTAPSFPNSLNTAPSSSKFGNNVSNTSPAFDPSSNGMFSGSNAKNVSFGASSKIEDSSAAVPGLSSGSTATTSAGGFNFGGFGGFSSNPVVANVGVSLSSTTTPMFGFPTTTTTSSSSFPASSAATMFELTSTTTNSPKFNNVPPSAPLFGIPLPSSASITVAPPFGTPANTMRATPQFGSATTTTTVNSGIFPIATPSSSMPFFGIGAPPSSTTMFGIPTTTTTTNMFGAQTATEKAPMFGMNNGAPIFGQQSNGLTFGQQHVQQPTATPSASPFIFGVPTTTTNSSSVFQMPPAVATPFFGMQSFVASTPSGFGASVFSTPTFGATKSDSFPSTIGFGVPTPNAPFGTSQGIGSAAPSFGAAAGAKSMFGASSASSGQTGVVPTFGAVASTNGPSFSFGNGMQNSQTAPSPFTFGGGSSGSQFNDSSKMVGSGHTSKRGLDDGSSNGANPAKRTSDMFGNQIVNANQFHFGSGQQQAAPANVWNQQQPSAAANNKSIAFSTTLPAAGFNFTAAASQFNFPAAPINNPGGVFQFGGMANQQATPNPFGNASNAAQNTFNNANASNPFDVAPSNSTRVIKKAVRKTFKR